MKQFPKDASEIEGSEECVGNLTCFVHSPPSPAREPLGLYPPIVVDGAPVLLNNFLVVLSLSTSSFRSGWATSWCSHFSFACHVSLDSSARACTEIAALFNLFFNSWASSVLLFEWVFTWSNQFGSTLGPFLVFETDWATNGAPSDTKVHSFEIE